MPSLRLLSGDEHVQWVALGGTDSQDVGEQGVERLDDIRIGRGGLAISCARELSPGVTKLV